MRRNSSKEEDKKQSSNVLDEDSLLAENRQFPLENKGGTPLVENNDLPLANNDEAFPFVESREAPSGEREESLDLMTESTPEISPENFDKGLPVFF